MRCGSGFEWQTSLLSAAGVRDGYIACLDRPESIDVRAGTARGQAMVMVYRFRMWDVAADGFTLSTRWATRERIQAMGGERVGGGVEVADEWVGGEIAG